MVRRRALVVFTRSPEAEARAKGFRAASAAPLFRALLDSWTRLSRETGTDLVLASPASCRFRLEAGSFAPGARFLTQPAVPFGERVAAAARDAFALGFESVVLVGADTPAIGAGELRRVFASIEAGAVVLGPAADGGVYLIGAGARDADIGACLRLRDPRALVRLLSEAANRRREVVLLAPRREIDSKSDAARAGRLTRTDPAWAGYRFLLALALRGRETEPFSGHPPAATSGGRTRVPRGPPAA